MPMAAKARPGLGGKGHGPLIKRTIPMHPTARKTRERTYQRTLAISSGSKEKGIIAMANIGGLKNGEGLF